MLPTPTVLKIKDLKDPSFDKVMPEAKIEEAKHHDNRKRKSPPTKLSRISTMKSKKLSEVKRITDRNAVEQINSQIKKFIEFCEIHDIESDPAKWAFEDFTADLIDRYYSWLVKHGKNGKPLPSHQIYISGLKYFLEKKFLDDQNKLPFKSDPS